MIETGLLNYVNRWNYLSYSPVVRPNKITDGRVPQSYEDDTVQYPVFYDFLV